MISDAKDVAFPFPLMPFVLHSVISNEADQSQDYRSPVKCFLYGYKSAAALILIFAREIISRVQERFRCIMQRKSAHTKGRGTKHGVT